MTRPEYQSAQHAIDQVLRTVYRDKDLAFGDVMMANGHKAGHIVRTSGQGPNATVYMVLGESVVAFRDVNSDHVDHAYTTAIRLEAERTSTVDRSQSPATAEENR